MVMQPFGFARCPRIVFGSGAFGELPDIAAAFGDRALVVTGVRSLQASGRWDMLREGLDRRGVDFLHLPVKGEPPPRLVDDASLEFRGSGIEVVIAVGVEAP